MSQPYLFLYDNDTVRQFASTALPEVDNTVRK